MMWNRTVFAQEVSWNCCWNYNSSYFDSSGHKLVGVGLILFRCSNVAVDDSGLKHHEEVVVLCFECFHGSYPRNWMSSPQELLVVGYRSPEVSNITGSFIEAFSCGSQWALCFNHIDCWRSCAADCFGGSDSAKDMRHSHCQLAICYIVASLENFSLRCFFKRHVAEGK